METILRLTGRQYRQLQQHLFPGDGKEAVAIALCGRRAGKSRHVLTVHRIEPIPYDVCTARTPVRVSWPTEVLEPLLKEAARRGFALLKIHSHPDGLPRFSSIDNVADRDLFPSVYGWVDDDLPHASAVMLPDGRIFGRVVGPEGEFTPLASVAVAGDDLSFWHHEGESEALPEFTLRHAQAFGEGTTQRLRRLSIAVVGCSGTGSPVVEMLARLGVGELVLVDPDHLEPKNQNRIVNATARATEAEELKVAVLAHAVRRMGLGTRVVPIGKNLFDPRLVRRVAECDIVFGCMDGVEGRDLLNRLAAFYSIPYVDVGVRLDADGEGGVDQICGTVNYLQPDGSSLLSRGAYTVEQLRTENLRRTDPAAYAEQVRAKYIVGVQEDRPAVISVNFFYASLAVNELLARLHPYRDDDNEGFAQFGFSLTQARIIKDEEGAPCRVLARHVGRGDTRPLLTMPSLSTAKAGA